MSYRNLTVDGVNYQYVIGKTHTKVKGVGVIENDKIHTFKWRFINPCGSKECSCESYEKRLIAVITPKCVAEYIEQKIAYPKHVFTIVNPPDGLKVNGVYSTRSAEDYV